MSCLTVTVSRVEDFDATVSSRIGGMDAALSCVRDFSVAVEQVCSVPFRPYLEIEPEIIWVTPWGTNDVLSNTHWNVD